MTTQPPNHSLFNALLLLQSKEECELFLNDLCTPAEIKAMQERFRVAQLLYQNNLSYRDIHNLTGVSLATISRVARFLNVENYKGYQLVLNRLYNKNLNPNS